MMSMAKDSVNIRAAFLHNLADALGSVAVIFAGTLILLYDWRLADPLVTLMISGYILWHAGVEIGPVIRILMLGSPDDPPVADVLARMRAEPGVADVHHLHLWRMQEHETALEAHVVQDGPGDPAALRQRLKQMLGEAFHIHHTTLEMETEGQACRTAQAIGH